MDKSNSVDTLKIEQLVHEAVEYLRRWTKEELRSIIDESSKSNRLPVIAPIGQQGYIVGNYGICPTEDKKWWRVNYRYSDQEYIFVNKAAAVCFALSQQTGKIILADKILKQDQEVGKFQLKSEMFKERFYQACRRKNRDKADLFKSRYQEVSLKLVEARNVLEKSLKSTKYF